MHNCVAIGSASAHLPVGYEVVKKEPCIWKIVRNEKTWVKT